MLPLGNPHPWVAVDQFYRPIEFGLQREPGPVLRDDRAALVQFQSPIGDSSAASGRSGALSGRAGRHCDERGERRYRRRERHQEFAESRRRPSQRRHTQFKCGDDFIDIDRA